MEMVAAAKMRRAQQQALAMRPYATKARDVLVHLASQRGANEELHPLLRRRATVERVAIILFTSNKGLCGGYNHNILRLADQFSEDATVPISWITVGRKGRNATARSGRPIIADFEEITDQPGLLEITAIARLVIQDFLAGQFDEVQLMYTDFINTMVQKPHVRPLLPLQYGAMDNKLPGAQAEATPALIEYVYEPSPSELLDTVVPRLVELQIYEALLEAKASEHSARMVAMRAATDNAEDLVSALTLTYNQVRQSAITKEMLDIVGGTEALAQRR